MYTSFMDNGRVLLTGAAGFLGSHLALRYLARGYEVLGMDNFSSSDLNSEHLSMLNGFTNFKFVEKDICDVKYFDEVLFDQRKFDFILNFACPASPPIYQSIPIETSMTCAVGVNNVLRLARHMGSTVLHASTSEVYGDPDQSPQSESYWGYVNPYGIRSCYDSGKRFSESLLHDYRLKYGVNTKVVRIFNTYGPHMSKDDGRVVTNFIDQMLNDRDITVFGNGLQTRSFCYVDDLVEGIVRMADSDPGFGGPVNLGNPNEFTILELMKVLGELIPESESSVVFHDLPSDDPKKRRPDITLAKRMLGWEPKVQLREGLTKTIEYFRRLRAR